MSAKDIPAMRPKAKSMALRLIEISLPKDKQPAVEEIAGGRKE
jgi:hypothetical protein